jgi:hypothetical protein
MTLSLPRFRSSLLPAYTIAWLVCIHPSHDRGATSFVPLGVGRMILDHATVGARALPQGSSLRVRLLVSRSINTYLTPSEPLADTFRLPDFAVIRNASAVQEGLSRLPVGPSFHCLILLNMSPSSTPGRSAIAYIQFLHRRCCLHLV